MTLAQELSRRLLQINAIKLNPQNPFTWASGWRSPIYCDNRLSLSYPDVRNLVIDGLISLIDNWDDVDVIVGVATAGIPHGAVLADRLGKPFSYVRSKAKGHGRQNQIEGHLEKGQNAVMIEDLISTGGSLIQATQPITEMGVSIEKCLAIFTYGFNQSVENMQNAGLSFSTVATYDILLKEAINLSYISETDLLTLQSWREDPSVWGQ